VAKERCRIATLKDVGVIVFRHSLGVVVVKTADAISRTGLPWLDNSSQSIACCGHDDPVRSQGLFADEINKSSRLNKISANRQCNSEARQKGVRLRAAWGWGNVQSEAAKRWDGATC
jgi:hypothetical protein